MVMLVVALWVLKYILAARDVGHAAAVALVSILVVTATQASMAQKTRSRVISGSHARHFPALTGGSGHAKWFVP
jgi:ABC-type iron transport system FetAB permease component